MAKKKLILIGTLITALLAVFVIYKFRKSDKSGDINPEFANYITAFTSGMVSTGSSIKIVLKNETSEIIEYGKPIEKDLFDFDPSIKGSAFWLDSHTIEFVPEERLPSNTSFEGEFYLDEIIGDLPEDLKTFVFSFNTMEQSFEVNIENVKAYEKHELKWQKLIGYIETADFAEAANLEKVIEAQQSGKKLKFTWEHDSEGKRHNFVVDSISRKETPEKVILSWDGKSMGAVSEGTREIEIPALDDFKLMDARVIQSPDQYVLLQFSDPLDEKQNLDGLISLDNYFDLKFVIEDNEIKAFPSSRQTGSKTLNVDAGVKNVMGYKMKSPMTKALQFEELKPAVKLIGNGVILPSSNGLIFPFEAVNIKAVDVKVIKIFEHNVLQFLQVNNLSGEREMKRVGRVVLKKTVLLNSAGHVDFGRWNTFSLDLAELMSAEPGAIYKVILSFKKEYSTYHCEGDEKNQELELVSEISDPDDDEASNYDYYDDYYYDDYYYEDYDWNQRENPCHGSYYGSKNDVSRNVLASDLGIIAKKGNSGSLSIMITDIKTTKPLSGVTVELYNYQQHKIFEASTNSDGMLDIEIKDKPFFLVAKKDKQRGYLKLDDGSSLSYSAFDVSGNTVQKGLKGFIYTERGVWRPGDSLFVMFILEDKIGALPKSHPVTFELINPLGQSVNKITKGSSVNGFYNFSTATSQDAPTGNYTARVRIGGVYFTKNLKVETIMPNRLKLNLDFGKEKLFSGDSPSGKLSAKWLHGAIAKNLKAKVDVVLNQSSTKFEKFEKYTFDDPARRFTSEEQNIFDGKLNEEGTVSISPKIETKDAAPGVLKANFTVRVFEEGGNFSIDRFSMPYYPYSTFVGIEAPKPENAYGMLATDTTYKVKVVTLNAHGKPVPSVKLQTEVYKIDWRWWWDSGSENLSNYISNSYHRALHKGEVITNSSGQAEFKLNVKYPEWGRFLIRVSDPDGGHASGQIIYMDWPGWVKRDNNNNNPGGASMLVFTSDKQKYNVGETAMLTIPSSEGGRALISLENGTKIIRKFWVETQKGQTKVEIPIEAEMTPNFYASVSLIQPHAQTKNDLPIRLYGIIPVLVEDPHTHLAPVIKMPDVLAPEENVSITVSEKEGKAMTYTIAVVDEGLLDLTRFKTPDPWPEFYAREALGVKTWDLYDYVIGAYGAELQRLLSIGGDEEMGKKGGKKANRFKPMVKFLGPFKLEKGDKQTHTFKMPQYVGSVKTMVIAGDNGAYGSTDKVTPVRKPLMILGTLPRVLGPGEEVKLPVTVFAMEKHVKEVTVEIIPQKPLELSGEAKKSITFTQPGDEVVSFDLRVAKAIGIGKVKIIARSGKEKAEYDIELDVRNPNPKVVNIVDAMIEPGQKWQNAFDLPGIKGTNKGTLEMSSIPPLNLKERIRYLIEYPHGCIEQTTSSGFPQLYLTDLMQMDETTKQRINENIKATINRIRTFQLSSGGFSYWPGNGEPNDWGTSYAGHFLLEAEIKGYNLPSGLKENWKKFQKQRALSWSKGGNNGYYNDDLTQAYRLYTLALAKAPELGAMNRLKENGNLSLQAKWRLAAAYVLAGQPEVAKQITSGVSKSVKQYRELSYTYGSSERDEAMILETLVLMNDKQNSATVFKQVAQHLGSKTWMSTQTTAYCLLAASRFLGITTTSKVINAAYKLDDKNAVPVNSQNPIVQVDLNSKSKENGNVEIENKGQGALFVRLILEGVPPTGDQTSVENNLKLNVVYRLPNGSLLDPSKLEQGTDFIAEVTLTNPGILGHYKEMSLSQIFPSGWEIHNARMDMGEGSVKSSYSTYQDIRDDRVYTYFDLNKNETKTFRILLNAAYLGKYYLPTISCEAMYDNSISAREPGQWVEVVNPGE